jgi:membrane protease YdiL (CAAX protease family)
VDALAGQTPGQTPPDGRSPGGQQSEGVRSEGGPPDRVPPEGRARGEELPEGPPPGAPTRAPDSEREPHGARSGPAAWPPWAGPAALAMGVLLAAAGGLLVDIPALALGVNVTASHVPAGLEIADTAVQDVGFVVAAVFFAQLGGRAVRASQFGLRSTRLWRSVRLVAVTVLAFLAFSASWSVAFNAPKEKLLEQLGSGESVVLLLLSAALTCALAPVCEELLFRGFIFPALRNWRGPRLAALITGVLFGAIHVGSAPAIDLVPLAVLGVALCALYQSTGSIYPCFAVHSLNNSLAFGLLEKWEWSEILALMVCALALIAAAVLAMRRAGLIAPETAADIGAGG